VISFYKAMTSKPIFLIGHSNGSLSIAEFLNQSSDHQKLISGVIFSGGRNETELKQKFLEKVTSN
jgi:alpha-beta hydrolase superfamily lysophospholipase